MDMSNALLTEEQAAKFLNYSPRFLQRRRAIGDGPRFVRISSRAIRYRLKDLQEWVEARVKKNTSETSK